MPLLSWIIVFCLLGGLLSVLAAALFLVLSDSLREHLLPHLVSFATGTLHAATTTAVVVEILNVFAMSPPVPQVSTVSSGALILVTFSLITFTAPVISSIVSPFIRKAVRKEEICASVALPSIMERMVPVIKSSERFLFSISNLIAS